jgi:hypothetical protein
MGFKSVCDCGSHGLTLALVVAGGCRWCCVLWLVPAGSLLDRGCCDLQNHKAGLCWLNASLAMKAISLPDSEMNTLNNCSPAALHFEGRFNFLCIYTQLSELDLKICVALLLESHTKTIREFIR